MVDVQKKTELCTYKEKIQCLARQLAGRIMYKSGWPLSSFCCCCSCLGKSFDHRHREKGYTVS